MKWETKHSKWASVDNCIFDVKKSIFEVENMINAQGNYEWMDFESEKPRFIDAFVRFYGEKYRDIITKRINDIEYKPYLDREFVTDYYGKVLSENRDELCHYFGVLAACHMSDEMKDLVWNSEKEQSDIIYSLFGGVDFEKSRALSQETKKEIRELREKIANAFKLSHDPVTQYQQIRRLYTMYRRATRELANFHKSDILCDAQKYFNNSFRLSKYYLASIRTDGLYKFSKGDTERLARENFTNADLLAMDSYGLFYTNSLDNPGLASYFTTENFAKIAQINVDRNIDPEAASIMFGQLKYAYINGAKLKYLTKEEIEEYTLEFTRDQILKVLNEYNYQMRNHFNLFLDRESADTIEGYRELYAMQLSSGCKFRANLDAYNKTKYTHSDNDELQYCMYPGYVDSNPNKPHTTIFFNESEYYDKDVLLSNLIHEIDHCVTHGRATKVIKRYLPVVRKGALGAVNKFLHFILRDKPKDSMGRAIVQSGVHYDKYYLQSGKIIGKAYEHQGMADLEENINERLAQEISEIYLYNNNSPFVDSALYDEKAIHDEKDDRFECQYLLWNFLTEDFYNTYYKAIKAYRINHKFPFYFSSGKLCENRTDRVMSYIKDKYDRHFRPGDYKRTGFVDYQKVEKLGDLIEAFKENIMPAVNIADDAAYDRFVSGDYSDQTPEAVEALHKCIVAKDKIMRSMRQDLKYQLSKPAKSSEFTPTNLR